MGRTRIRRGLLPRAYEASQGTLAMPGRQFSDGMATNADWWHNPHNWHGVHRPCSPGCRLPKDQGRVIGQHMEGRRRKVEGAKVRRGPLLDVAPGLAKALLLQLVHRVDKHRGLENLVHALVKSGRMLIHDY